MIASDEEPTPACFSALVALNSNNLELVRKHLLAAITEHRDLTSDRNCLANRAAIKRGKLREILAVIQRPD